MDNKILMLFIVILLMGISSCSEDVAFQETVDLEGKWPANKKLIFEFDIDDTASNYMLIYTIRNSIDYPYYNLYVKYSIKDTLGRKIDENLQELMLMDKKTGRPLGQGFGQMNDHSFTL
jgi:gliding motility-associated lipoprotein GldH